MKRTFRFTLLEEEHKDLIQMIERCPRVFRNELIILALKTLKKNKNEFFNLSLGGEVTVDDRANLSTQDKKQASEPGTITSPPIDLANIFKL